MSGRNAISYVVAAGLGLAAGVLNIPDYVILLAFLGICCALVLSALVFVGWHTVSKAVTPKSPPPPTPCPSCGHTEHEWVKGGLWDGFPDPVTGKRPCGSFSYGVCKECGCRWGQWDESPAYVVSEEEWEREIERYRREARTPYRHADQSCW